MYKENVVSINGIIIGAIAFLVIGIFHPIVIYGEYHFGTKVWPVFLGAGILLCAVSLFVENIVFNAALGITAFCCFWSIFELFDNRSGRKKGLNKRDEKGEFPKAKHV